MRQVISILCCCTTLFSVISFTDLQAQPSEEVVNKCTKEELMTFFPQQVVESVLLKAKVPHEKAVVIAKELSQKDREFTKIVENKASKMDQDPFKDLSQRDLAIKIYRETLYEVFAKVLKANGVTNDDQIQSLLEEMSAAKSKLFIDCIRKQTVQTPAPQNPGAPVSPEAAKEAASAVL